MSSQQKRGFRLPWAERSAEEGAAAATLEADSAEPTASDRIEDGVGDELGEGPFHLAEASTPEASTDASPEAPDLPETTAEAAMIESESATAEPSEAAPPTGEAEAWPTSDQRAATADAPEASEPTTEAATEAPPPPIHVEGETRPTRANPLVAGLVKAMREAAQASRAETTQQLQAEASARVEAIREGATGRAADLRKQADEDVAGIRDWSKAEIARIRQETDERIEHRKGQLTEQTRQHEANVEQQVERVQSTVSVFETSMDSFFKRLLAENDPAQLAALAEQAPEPPDLSAEAFSTGAETEGGAWTGAAWSPGLGADAAAEAEAAATEGLDMSTTDEWPASVMAAARRPDDPAGEFEPAGVANSRMFVNGLTSVAGISAFKGALSQLPGVKSVSVSSGEPGVFIFTVVHAPETDLQGAVAGLEAFNVRITDASGDSLTVTAHEPAV